MLKEILETAQMLDRQDDLRHFRQQFLVPPHKDGSDQLYFCGHSLGLQPQAVESEMHRELQSWRERGVAGHFIGEPAWLDYNESLRESLCELAGARPAEVVVMNTLTVNLHLMMVSFYRPRGRRRKILIEKHAFPSDRYAVASQIRFHGLDPVECLLELEPDSGSRIIEESSIESYLRDRGEEIALVLWPGVQYASGQAFDLQRIAAAAHQAGARVGFDLAHSMGNLPLQLHDSECDFAAWCHYKYLNAGPGAIAGCFVHERHHDDNSLPRLQGWWGNDPSNRFRMESEFTASPGAQAWELSTPPLFSTVPLRVSLDLFRQAGMRNLREKSTAMTGFLIGLIQNELMDILEILTPQDESRRGCQLSLRVRGGREAGRQLFHHLENHGVIADWREPDIIRVSPVPLYNRYQDCARLVMHIRDWAGATNGK